MIVKRVSSRWFAFFLALGAADLACSNSSDGGPSAESRAGTGSGGASSSSGGGNEALGGQDSDGDGDGGGGPGGDGGNASGGDGFGANNGSGGERAGVGGLGGDSGGDGGSSAGGSGGDDSNGTGGQIVTLPDPSCYEVKECDELGCGSKACFDEGRCATDVTSWYGTEHNDRARAVIAQEGGGYVIATQLSYSADLGKNMDFALHAIDTSGSELWTKTWGSVEADYPYTLAEDEAGNLYLVGSTAGALDGKTPSGGSDGFITKLDSLGDPLWSTFIGGADNDSVYDLRLAAGGGLFVAGTLNQDPVAKAGEGFVARVNEAGTVTDTLEFGAQEGVVVRTMTIDEDENWIVAGGTYGDLGALNAGRLDAFVRKYSSAWDEAWTLQFGSDQNDVIADVAADTVGSVYVLGFTRGAIGGNKSPRVAEWTLFVSKITPQGDLMWTHYYNKGGDRETNPAKLIIAQNGDLLVAGTVLGDIAGNDSGNGYNTFYMRLCPNGGVKALQEWPSASDGWARDIAEAPDGDVLIVGDEIVDTDVTGGSSLDAFVIRVSPE